MPKGNVEHENPLYHHSSIDVPSFNLFSILTAPFVWQDQIID